MRAAYYVLRFPDAEQWTWTTHIPKLVSTERAAIIIIIIIISLRFDEDD